MIIIDLYEVQMIFITVSVDYVPEWLHDIILLLPSNLK